MSGQQPATPQRRELEIMRVLFERRLKGRAIALADSRWPGSGKMVDLAYEWSQLSPTERREQLSAFGPDEIARLREFTALNPELAAAVDELDRRGVLPHLEAAASEAAAAAQTAFIPESRTPERRQEQPAAAQEPARAEQPSRPVRAEVERESARAQSVEPSQSDIDKVEMPSLDLGLPSTSDFLSDEAHRRQEAVQAAEATMERVRRRLEQSTQRAFDRSATTTRKAPEPARAVQPVTEPDVQVDERPSRSRTSAIAAPAGLSHLFRERRVTSLGRSDAAPSDDELVSLANDLQLGFTEFTIAPGRHREVFGGLVTQLGRIEVEPGPLPRAIAKPNLIVIRGRLSPHLARRIEEGYLDIPGTRASVQVHPDARVLVLPG